MPQIFLVWIPAANVVFMLSNQFNGSCFRFTVTWRLNQPRDLFLLCLTVFARSIARNIKKNPSNFWWLLTKFEGFLAPLVGLEPTTPWLTVRCSTDWAKEEYSAKTVQRTVFTVLCWRFPIFPGRLQPSIVGTIQLNFRVRNGNGCTLNVINTNYVLASPYLPGSSPTEYCRHHSA